MPLPVKLWVLDFLLFMCSMAWISGKIAPSPFEMTVSGLLGLGVIIPIFLAVIFA